MQLPRVLVFSRQRERPVVIFNPSLALGFFYRGFLPRLDLVSW